MSKTSAACEKPHTIALLSAVLLGFRSGTNPKSLADANATGLPTREERLAWRQGWMAGAESLSYLQPTNEHTQQRALFEWLLVCEQACPELELAYAVPNGGKRPGGVGGKLKAEGVKAGVPDVCLPLSAGPHGALYIEMKSIDGKVSDHQEERMGRLEAAGNRTVVCFSWDAAATAVVEYMGQRLGVAA